MGTDEGTPSSVDGDARSSEALLPLVYEELRRMADRRLAREAPGQTLQATALVHEAYLRLVRSEPADAVAWNSRGHFFMAAAEAMRRILVERARAKGTAKRGGAWCRASIDLAEISLDDVPAELLELDEALSALAAVDPEKARLVELRFFGGLTLEQSAAFLDMSSATAGRHWAFARAWLYRRLTEPVGEE